ncbi:MAG: hypothetical protein JWM67_1897 [Mycobacterium sp.]|jgi:predicted NBD/HSP70 family sugar kinase|nr:hypothetical protein [Mycobacterium sp.]
MVTAVRGVTDPLRLLLAVLRRDGAATRAQLGEATGLSRSTVSGVLGDLRRAGLVGDATGQLPTKGRPAARVRLLSRAGVAVGVDLGRTHVRVAVCDAGHTVLAERSCRMAVDEHADEALDEAARLVADALAECGARPADVLGVGLGVPAPMGRDRRVPAMGLLPGWTGRDPAAELGSRLHMTVVAENDANLGTLAESVWGAGRTASWVVYLKIASGVGAGIVHDGSVLRGAAGLAGELGHTTVTDGGVVCRCGNRGCLEGLVGGGALLGQLAAAGRTDIGTVADLLAAARRGDAGCRRVLADAGETLGLAVANVVNVLNPDLVVCGGELGLAGDLLLEPLRTRLHRGALAVAGSEVDVVPAALGERAEALGGCLLVLRESPECAERLVRSVAEQLDRPAAAG